MSLISFVFLVQHTQHAPLINISCLSYTYGIGLTWIYISDGTVWKFGNQFGLRFF